MMQEGKNAKPRACQGGEFRRRPWLLIEGERTRSASPPGVEARSPCGVVRERPCPWFCALWRGRHHCPDRAIIPTNNLSRTTSSSQLKIMRIEMVRRVFAGSGDLKFTWPMESI